MSPGYSMAYVLQDSLRILRSYRFGVMICYSQLELL
jgi:hypothetical protein